MPLNSRISCQYAQCQFSSFRYKQYLKNVEVYHKNDMAFNIKYGVKGCLQKYFKVKSLLKHIKNKHYYFYMRNNLSKISQFASYPKNSLSLKKSGEMDVCTISNASMEVCTVNKDYDEREQILNSYQDKVAGKKVKF